MKSYNNLRFTIKIGGEAGQGIKSAGVMLAKVATRSGYHTYSYTEYPSLIRGGHNVTQIEIAEEPVTGPSDNTDFLIALNQETLDLHANELTSGSGVLMDTDKKLTLPKNCPFEVVSFPVPLKELAGKDLLVNTVALGATLALLKGDLEILKDLLQEAFGAKGEEVIAMNVKAAEAGYNYVVDTYAKGKNVIYKNYLEKKEITSDQIVINGNEAVALGAIAAGLQFAAIYPMSPISNILHVLAAHQEEYGYVYKQPEDEISAINMAIGASFAGARSMTTTSGGGFCLMTEGLGLAGMTETPLVIVDGMRGAPATGLPTWSEQSDMQMVLRAHQGDFPRIVLAAGDPEEAFYLTMQAFNLADKYQTPVVLLIDKNICENDQSFSLFDTSGYKVDRGKFTMTRVEDFKRFALAKDGISERSVPGSGNFFIANSDEHDEFGYSNEEIANRNEQMQKRMAKLETCATEDMAAPVLYGPEDAEVTLVSWGSNKGSILQAMKGFKERKVNFMHITWINPFPAEAVAAVLTKAKHVVNIECNYSAHMGSLIREKTGIEIKDNLLKYDGRPFFVEAIEAKLREVL